MATKSLVDYSTQALENIADKTHARYNSFLADEALAIVADRKRVAIRIAQETEATQAITREAGVETPLGHLTADEAFIVFKLIKPDAPKLGITEKNVPAPLATLRSTLFNYLKASGINPYPKADN